MAVELNCLFEPCELIIHSVLFALTTMLDVVPKHTRGTYGQAIICMERVRAWLEQKSLP